MNENAYRVNFLGDYGVSATFNVPDLSPYLKEDHLANLRANSPQQGEDDGGPSKETFKRTLRKLKGVKFKFQGKGKGPSIA